MSETVIQITHTDGRPNSEEAWGLLPKNEYDSCVWTIEMATAYAAVSKLIKSGDLSEARDAFKTNYKFEVAMAREVGIPPTWSVLLGSDGKQYPGVIAIALRKNKRNVSGIGVFS